MSIATERDVSKSFKDLNGLMYCRSKCQKKKEDYSAYFINFISCIFVNTIVYLTNIKNEKYTLCEAMKENNFSKFLEAMNKKMADHKKNNQ